MKKLAVVSGATSGIGKATVKLLSAVGFDIVLLYRNKTKVDKVIDELSRISKSEFFSEYCDLSLQSSIREFVGSFKKKYGKLDVLCNMGGIISLKERYTEEGIELTWATDYLSHFLLTNLMLPFFPDDEYSTIITISGSAHRGAILNLENPQLKGSYNGVRAAKQAALARIIFTFELAKRLSNTKITANTFCPGFTKSSLTNNFPFPLNILGRFAMLFAKSPEKTLQIVVMLSQNPHKYNGKYFENGHETITKTIINNLQYSEKLWEISKKMTKLE